MTIKQWQLYYLGYYGGEIDGIWGAGSKAAQKVITDGKIAMNGFCRIGNKRHHCPMLTA